jgi:hypothetical protein
MVQKNHSFIHAFTSILITGDDQKYLARSTSIIARRSGLMTIVTNKDESKKSHF